ncbi:UNVERIFIED_CONTAM: hypothetical protein RMT77_007107 [Armadillidium vulgare]
MNRSFHSPGLTINSVRVIGPEFSSHRRVDQLNYSLRSQASDLSMQNGNGDDRRDTSTNSNNISVNDSVNMRSRPSIMNSDSNYQSKPSPDEIVIKGRGRRSLPLKWSPIPIESPQKTPLSSLIRKSPKKGVITLRSSPRKRLQLNDDPTSDLIQNRKSLLNTSPLARNPSPLARKTSEADMVSTNSKVSDRSVNKLSKDQLVHVLNSIIETHPFIKDEIEPLLNTKESDSPSTNAFDINSNNCHNSKDAQSDDNLE